MAYTVAIFDMDGTILDTLEDLADAINHALVAHDLPGRSLEQVRAAVGNGVLRLVRLSVPEGCEPALEEAVLKDFRAYYAAHAADKTSPYPGIRELLAVLAEAGVRCAVVSNKPDAVVAELARDYFPGAFEAACGEREGIERKPAPDSTNAVLAELGVSERSDACYIGDSDVDIATAVAAGLDCLSVTWGFRDRDFLIAHGATRLVDTTAELADAVLH